MNFSLPLSCSWTSTIKEHQLRYRPTKYLTRNEATSKSRNNRKSISPPKQIISALLQDPARANRHRPGQLSDSIYADDAGKLDEENDGEQLYRAPKTSSVEYSADSSTHDAQLKKAEAKLAREERKLRNSEFFQAVKEAAGDFTDNFSKPQEVRLDEDDGLCSRRQKALRVEAEKRAYEEDNLVRLRRTKAEKKELSKKTRRGGAGVVGLGELVSELDRNFGAGKYEKFKEARGNLEGLRAAKGGGSGAAAKGGSSGEREKKKQGAGDFGKSSTRTGVQKTGGEKRGGKKGGGKKGGGKKGGGKKGGKRR